jgi:hypothetical protein
MDFGLSKNEKWLNGVRYGFDMNPLVSGKEKENMWGATRIVLIWTF